MARDRVDYGKSNELIRLLSAALLYEIVQLRNSQSDVAVGFFYFDFNDVEKHASRKAIRSLLFQLAQHSDASFQPMEQLYQRCGYGQQQPSEGAVQSLLLEAIKLSGTKYIVLDALDECTDREDLLQLFCGIITSKPIGLRVVVTSRRTRDIEERLGSITTYNINIQSAVVDEDIRIYVQDRLATDHKLKKWPTVVHDEITRVVMEKANGM